MQRGRSRACDHRLRGEVERARVQRSSSNSVSRVTSVLDLVELRAGSSPLSRAARASCAPRPRLALDRDEALGVSSPVRTSMSPSAASSWARRGRRRPPRRRRRRRACAPRSSLTSSTPVLRCWPISWKTSPMPKSRRLPRSATDMLTSSPAARARRTAARGRRATAADGASGDAARPGSAPSASGSGTARRAGARATRRCAKHATASSASSGRFATMPAAPGTSHASTPAARSSAPLPQAQLLEPLHALDRVAAARLEQARDAGVEVLLRPDPALERDAEAAARRRPRARAPRRASPRLSPSTPGASRARKARASAAVAAGSRSARAPAPAGSGRYATNAPSSPL